MFVSSLTWLVTTISGLSFLCGSNNNIDNNDKDKNKFCIKDNNNKDIQLKKCHVVLNDICSTNNKLSDLQKLCGNGKEKQLFVCSSTRCKLKQQFLARDRAVSSCTKRIYDCITPPGSIYIDCNFPNVIYLITCNKCSLQYVGETVCKLNARFGGHRKGIKNPEKYGTCRILSNHFGNDSCKGANYTV